ncbi:MAG: hypothetical protein GX842_03510 [Spirochaetales bacterium]|nr:hypothetical protein [Spirochaetales bacterium]
MDKKFVFILLVVVTLLGCTTTGELTYSDEDLALGKEAVIKMAETLLLSAVESFSAQFVLTPVNALPATFEPLLRAQNEVPGLRGLLEGYLEAMRTDVVEIVREIPDHFGVNVMSQMDIKDPYALIKGNNDAVTRFFASFYAHETEQWLPLEIQKREGGIGAWNKMVRTYNNYLLGKGRLSKEEVTLLEGGPTLEITVALIRHLIEEMSRQEALIRSLAPTYEDPLILLFSR